jgi:6-phosphofructokinase 1
VLGHVQRGGNPTAFDHVLSSRLGTAAVGALADGESGAMIGLRGRHMERVPLGEVTERSRPLDSELYEMAAVLAGLSEETSLR